MPCNAIFEVVQAKWPRAHTHTRKQETYVVPALEMPVLLLLFLEGDFLPFLVRDVPMLALPAQPTPGLVGAPPAAAAAPAAAGLKILSSSEAFSSALKPHPMSQH